MDQINDFTQKNTFKGQKIFTDSPSSDDWIKWVTMVFIAFAILTLIRLFFGFFIALFYIIALVLFALGIYRRKRIWFGGLVIALIPCLLIEIYLCFYSFSYGFNLKLLLGIIFSLLGLAIVAYTAFCAYKMYKYFPEDGEGYQNQQNEPLNTAPHAGNNNAPGMAVKPLNRDVHREPGLDDSNQVI